MLTELQIRNIVLIEALDLGVGAGLTALTGETGAGKSIILDSLGLATGARGDAGLVRRGAAQASATAVFEPPPDHPAYALLEQNGLAGEAGEPLILRRQLAADGRSRAFVNDQAVGVGVLRELGAALVEVHGQHQTVGLLDARTHRGLLDGYGGLQGPLRAVAAAWKAWRAAEAEAERLSAAAAAGAAEIERLTDQLNELDRLSPQPGEEAALAEQRAMLGAAEKALGDIAAAREAVEGADRRGDKLSSRLAGAFRALDKARERTAAAIRMAAEQSAGASEAEAEEPAGQGTAALAALEAAAAAVDRVLTEADEALALIDEAARVFDVSPGALDKAEERLFALRATARKLGVAPDALPQARLRIAESLRLAEDGESLAAAARAEAEARGRDYAAAAAALSQGRAAAAERLTAAVAAELPPLKLDKARFRVRVEAGAAAPGPDGQDRVLFEIMTNPGADFGPLERVASGGELARLALALKAALAGREQPSAALMIFDEVDQGVGGAVADAVGLRLRRLAEKAQVLVVTHSPQVAARADSHWRVSKSTNGGGGFGTAVTVLPGAAREEELARMLAGAEVTDAARAAARALMQAA